MWEQINKKQNEDEMLQLQYYARTLYNTADTLFLIKYIILILNVILGITNIDAKIIAITTIILVIIELLENYCIEKAANARKLFDAILFDFSIQSDSQNVKEKAYKMCNRKKKKFAIQKNNTGTDNPPGVKDWYTKNSGRSKEEIIFKCQKENTKWDEKITKINKVIVVSIIIIAFVIYICINYNNSVGKLLTGLAIAIELIIELVLLYNSYRKFNMNLAKRNYEIERIGKKSIEINDLENLQELINERRILKLIPFNSIHKLISIKMHNIIRKFN